MMPAAEHIGSLCSGYGGLDIALSAIIGLPVGWHAEIEKITTKTGRAIDNPVVEVLAARHPGTPNFGDITAIDWRSVPQPYALAAGFPCQAVSLAGRQLGEADPRWLWPAVRAAITALRPTWLALENVANLVSIRGGDLWRGILDDLRDLGYAVAWGILGACLSPVAGCHHRHRVFALAKAQQQPRDRTVTRWTGKACGVRRRPELVPTPQARDGRSLASPEVAQERWDASKRNLEDWASLLPTPTAQPYGNNRGGSAGRVGPIRHSLDSLASTGQLLPTPVTTDAKGARNATAGRDTNSTYNPGETLTDAMWSLLPTPRAVSSAVQQPEDFGRFAWAINRWAAVHGAPPNPIQEGPRGGVQVRSQFSEWMMGLPAGFVTDILPRTQALHAIGNGVFPLQAYSAFRTLLPLLPEPAANPQHGDARVLSTLGGRY